MDRPLLNQNIARRADSIWSRAFRRMERNELELLSSIENKDANVPRESGGARLYVASEPKCVISTIQKRAWLAAEKLLQRTTRLASSARPPVEVFRIPPNCDHK